MQTLDEMRDRHLLTHDQHGQIRAWIAAGRTPQAILEMPAHLWRALSLASVLMGFDDDLQRPAEEPLAGC
jgi:DNA-binding GntR family transcriptional regulator